MFGGYLRIFKKWDRGMDALTDGRRDKTNDKEASLLKKDGSTYSKGRKKGSPSSRVMKSTHKQI